MELHWYKFSTSNAQLFIYSNVQLFIYEQPNLVVLIKYFVFLSHTICNHFVFGCDHFIVRTYFKDFVLVSYKILFWVITSLSYVVISEQFYGQYKNPKFKEINFSILYFVLLLIVFLQFC